MKQSKDIKMNKFLIMSLCMLALAGCDEKPLEVNMDCDNAYRASPTFVNAKIYKDRADLIINDNIKISLPKKDDDSSDEMVYFQENGKPTHFVMSIDPEKQAIRGFGLGFIRNHSYSCQVYLSLKSGAKAKKRNNIEKCIDEICDKVYLNSRDGSFKLFLNIWPVVDIELSAEQAKKLSRNWDYSNPKLYNNTDGILNDYEKDACEALNRVNNYLNYKAAEFAAATTDSEYKCEKIATGELGDYVLKCKRSLHIWEKLKYDGEITAKFVSAGKNEIANYLEDLKENDFMYMNVVDNGKCYRVLSPEVENTDGLYAIEYCGSDI
jgi:hypothetical protein